MKSIKIKLIDSIENALKKITSVKQFKRGQGIPIDQDTALYPWLCFFDEIETKEEKNRVMMKTFELIIQVWVKKTNLTIDEQMDTIDAWIESTLLNDSDVANNCVRVRAKTSEKFYIDDDETGILQTTYDIIYAHKWKDPFDPHTGS